ncbi:enterobactin ABC transporter permease [Serinibacter arcticus]|uniref:Enterobactin ABC transporter permease n=1 Tax=Serinibacter arcticus TaxID=1655435 RepID=A0A2U1ZR89_9MICO|nr:iron chelate uptake ABC transporter family permease subunit [Serinibacter arcticus]PWD49460.1 enterobactin ABC transporter permease [Serinibacter arcticus]
MAETTTAPPPGDAAPSSRAARPLARRLRSSWPVLLVALVGLASAAGIALYDIPVPPGTSGHTTIVMMRLTSIVTVVIVGCAQGLATLVFQTVAGNRILTPSILGFDAMYRVVQTAAIFLGGAGALAVTGSAAASAVQTVVMVVFATALYGWLFSGRRANLHLLLLVGVVLGMGFASLATFMQRLLTPSEFDILTARLFGNISAADPDYLPWAGAIVGVVAIVLWRRRHVLDVVGLGRQTATSLGVSYQREVLLVLLLVALLVATSVSLVGPMTFLGFVVALLTYQLVGSHEHSRLIPVVLLLGATTLLLAYFVLRHVFYAQGLVTVIIELIGGSVFLIHLLRKGLR